MRGWKGESHNSHSHSHTAPLLPRQAGRPELIDLHLPVRICVCARVSVFCPSIVPPPPLYKLRPCPSYSRRRDRINLGPNFDSVPNVVQPHKTWVW